MTPAEQTYRHWLSRLARGPRWEDLHVPRSVLVAEWVDSAIEFLRTLEAYLDHPDLMTEEVLRTSKGRHER